MSKFFIEKNFLSQTLVCSWTNLSTLGNLLNFFRKSLFFYRNKASKLKKAIDDTVNKDRVHTKDLGGTASTSDVFENILVRLHLREITKLTTNIH